MNIDYTTYNLTPQSQAELFRHRRRYMSPTRSKPRSPRCQYIYRGRANMFPTSTAAVSSPTKPISIPSTSTPTSTFAGRTCPDTEPIFNMSPVHMHYLPPLRIKEPINVMTLRNCGGYRHESTNSYKLKPRGQSTHPTVASLLYTFPRPTSKPKPSLSLKDFPMKRPFGLVSQNRTQRLTGYSDPEQSTKLDDDVQDAHIPPPSLFLDVSPSPPRSPAFPLLITKKPSKHIRIIQNPIARRDGNGQNSRADLKKRSRVPTPAPSPKLRNSLKPALHIPDDAPPSSPSTVPSSLPIPTPLRRIPSLPIPIPHHKPREEDTGVFENVSLSIIGGGDDDDDDGHSKRAIKLGDGNTNAEDEHDGDIIDTHPCFQSNDLQLTFPALRDDLSNPTSPHLRLYPLLDGASSEHIGSRLRSSSLLPELELDLAFKQDRGREAGLPWFVPPSPLFPSSPRDESNQSSIKYTVGIEGEATRARKNKKRNRDRKMVEVEYFDNNLTDDRSPFLPARTVEPTSSCDLSSDLEPIFPVFSPTCAPTSNIGFGEYAYPALDENSSEFDGQNSREDSPNGSTMNPWLRVTTKFNNPTSNSTSTSDSNSQYTCLHHEFSEKQNYRNGKANLNVFNPPALPSFDGSDSGSGSDHSSGTPSSDSDSESQPFLSFPIPIFLPEDPYALTQVNVAKVPIGLGQQEGSFRSSVYGGCEDSIGKVGSQVEYQSNFQTQSRMNPPKPIIEQIHRRDTPTPTGRIKFTSDIPASQTETSNRFFTPVPWDGSEQGQKGQGRKRENGVIDESGAYGLLKKIIKRHGYIYSVKVLIYVLLIPPSFQMNQLVLRAPTVVGGSVPPSSSQIIQK